MSEQKPIDELDHRHTAFIVCPYCGYSHQESWEWGNGEGDYEDAECESCGKKFNWSRHVSISYSTRKVNEDERTETD